MSLKWSEEERMYEEMGKAFRDALDIPGGWVSVLAPSPYDWHMDGHNGWSVGIGIEMVLEDVGGGEDGPQLSVWPRKFVDVFVVGDCWYMGVYDNTGEGNEAPEDYDYDYHNPPPPDVLLHLQDLDGMESVNAVVERVVSMFAALNIEPKEA